MTRGDLGPAWLDSSYLNRVLVSVDARAGAGSNDWTCVVPPGFDHFWNNIRSDGWDLRVTLADGTTAVAHDRAAGFNVSTRTLTLEVQAHTFAAAEMTAAWLYYNQAAIGADTSTTFTPSSAYTGTIKLDDPRTFQHYLLTSRPRYDSDEPRLVLQKTINDTILVVWDLRRELPRSRAVAQGHGGLVGVRDAKMEVWNLTGPANVASMTTLASSRLFAGTCFMAEVKGGSDETEYTLRLTVNLTDGQSLERRATLRVKDVTP